MTSITQPSTEELVAELCRRLALGEPVRSHRYTGELATADQAREICHRLLDAAKADGLNGCQLCQS